MEGKTTQTKERIISNKMEFPSLMICTQNGYKEDALADIGLPVDILKIRSRPTEGNFEFDPESVWNEVTYSSNELNINWVFLLGKGQCLDTLDQCWSQISKKSGLGEKLSFVEIRFAAQSNSVSNWSDPTMAEVQEINTMSRGKCLLWSTKLKATRTYPVVGLYIKAPPNE